MKIRVGDIVKDRYDNEYKVYKATNKYTVIVNEIGIPIERIVPNYFMLVDFYKVSINKSSVIQYKKE